MPRALKFRTRPDASFNRPGVKVPRLRPAGDRGADDRRRGQRRAGRRRCLRKTMPAPTGRQLRMARRIAQKHGLKVQADQEAVEALRTRGIDPFERSNMLQLVPGQRARTGAAGRPPSARPAPPPAQARPMTIDADHRAGEIMKIQRDIAKRRRRRLALLVTRLSFFVGLPTLIAAIYYYAIATPMYATQVRVHHPAGRCGLGRGVGPGRAVLGNRPRHAAGFDLRPVLPVCRATR